MTTSCFRRVPSAALILVALTGCYETDQQLGPPEQSKVDVRCVGDWEFRDPQSGATVMRVRNFDRRQYYVEWAKVGEEPTRAAAFAAEVGGVSFAHLRELKPDGALPTSHFLVRFGVTNDDRLSLRFLDDKFFQGKDVSTSAKLRAVVEKNVQNESIYDAETYVGSRLSK
jgi:hypothetical protein